MFGSEQVLAKSCKMIAVMIVGFLAKGQRYPVSQWLQMFSIAGGISVFALTKDSKKSSERLMAHNPLLGYTLLFINLGMDGYTNVQQDVIKKKFPKTTSFSMMAFQVGIARSRAAFERGKRGYLALNFRLSDVVAQKWFAASTLAMKILTSRNRTIVL